MAGRSGQGLLPREEVSDAEAPITLLTGTKSGARNPGVRR